MGDEAISSPKLASHQSRVPGVGDPTDPICRWKHSDEFRSSYATPDHVAGQSAIDQLFPVDDTMLLARDLAPVSFHAGDYNSERRDTG